MKLSNEIIDGAQAAQRKWGVPASVGLAQCIQESSGFVHVPPGSNNGLGIKALKGMPSVVTTTHEVYHGLTETIHAHFAKFASIADCFDHWGQLLATDKVYEKAFAAKDDWLKFVELMAPHYATDPHYASSLISIIQKNKLARFDV